jgi:hypothetical protein
VNPNPLLGTWSLKSYVVTTAAGERSTPYGESPSGYLYYGPDARMVVIGAASDRISPAGPTPPDDQRLALYNTMFAYSGTYSLQADQVVHHVDISWNQVWAGTDQVRVFEVSGNTLTLSTRLMDAAGAPGSLYVLVWERVAARC